MRAVINQIEDSELKTALQTILDEQTLHALENLDKTDWKDPVTLGGYGLAALASLTAGYQKKKRMDGA